MSDIGVPTRHSHSLQGGNNAVGRVEKGAIGREALSPQWRRQRKPSNLYSLWLSERQSAVN